MSNTVGDDAGWQRRLDAERLEEIRAWREDLQWRPGAMRPEERERLVRVALYVVLGDRVDALDVHRSKNDTIVVRDADQHGFGFLRTSCWATTREWCWSTIWSGSRTSCA